MTYRKLVLAYMCALQDTDTKPIQDEIITHLPAKQCRRAYREALERVESGELADEFELT